jgi:LysR family transcriptional regulator for metE and metH
LYEGDQSKYNDYYGLIDEKFSLNIETIHLRIIAALDHYGTLTEAAGQLCLSQSALSHQIRHLEQRLGTPVWQKVGRRLRLTASGERLLETARRVLPVLEQTERTLRAYAEGKQAFLRIGVECYPCYEWLTGVIGECLASMPEIELDIVHQFQFSGTRGLLEQEIDLLITPDREAQPQLSYLPLFDYELVLLVAEAHPLADGDHVTAEQLAQEILITFPVAAERLDILTQFLWPADVRPLQHKTVGSIEIMLQLVAFRRGVCALPRWLAERYREKMSLAVLPLGRGIVHRLYAAIRREDASLPHLQRLIEVGAKSPAV